MRIPAVVSTVVLAAALVAGCGGDNDGSPGAGSGDYCKDLEVAKADFTALNSDTPDFDKFDEAFDTFHELAQDAPSEVSAEWKLLDGAVTTTVETLESVGLSFEDLGRINEGQLPDGVTAAELQALAPKLQEAFGDLSGDDFDAAGKAIEKHAKAECDLDISLD